MATIHDWLDDRTGYRAILSRTLFAPIPGGARWRYVWGTTLGFTFFLQMVTGICLWMTYSPSTTTAWESVYYIQNEMTLGWVVRGIHHFAAQTMMILLVLHLMQVVIDGAYRAPREVNFWIGLILMQIVMVLGVTGYLLPWDQRGYAATQIVTGIIGSTPIVGPAVQLIVQGGPDYGHLNLTRFFALHAGILPLCLLFFLFLHIYVFRRHGYQGQPKSTEPTEKYWPDQFLKDAVACLAVLAAIMACTLYWRGGELTAPADPAEAYSAARPEWYYLFLFKFLSLSWVSMIGAKTGLGESFGAVIVPGVAMTVIIFMPLIARRKFGHRFNVGFLWVVVGIAGVLTGMAVHADWISNSVEGKEYRIAVAKAHAEARRAKELAASPAGIPPEGAGQLLKNDPLTQGPKLFGIYCINCHQPESRTAEFTEPAIAPELADPLTPTVVKFASREWNKSVLLNFADHFKSLAKTQGDHAGAAEAILNGSMKDWSESNAPTLNDPQNAEDLNALVEFLYTQSTRPDALPSDSPVVQRGQEIFTTGKLKMGSVDACVDCHAMHPVVWKDGVRGMAEEALSEGLQPDLTGYGGTEWLKKMIATPHALYAGDSGNNAMPAFEDQLTVRELDMLARWLSLDYYPPQSTKH